MANQKRVELAVYNYLTFLLKACVPGIQTQGLQHETIAKMIVENVPLSLLPYDIVTLHKQGFNLVEILEERLNRLTNG